LARENSVACQSTARLPGISVVCYGAGPMAAAFPLTGQTLPLTAIASVPVETAALL